MRPVELQVRGFTAFRDEATLDFRDADLFALTGPTGSGKSSIVDAIVFALYGSVPRYGDRRAVEPVITLGKEEARVRFDFTVGDDAYTAVRVVRRTKTGATTAEARLEHGGTPLASSADEVTGAVERLLGLSYEHFIKAVVLPQGEFARFLHDKPAERQKLLRELLDLDIYRQVLELANERKSTADLHHARLQSAADQFAGMAARDEDTAERRVVELEALREKVAAVLGEQAALTRELEGVGKETETIRSAVATLESVRRPPDVAGLVERVGRADDALREVKKTSDEVGQKVADQEQAVGRLPEPVAVEAQIASMTLRDELSSSREVIVADAAATRGDMERRREAFSGSEAAVKAARDALDEMRRTHAAHEIARSLTVGEPCPVCGAPVVDLPRHDDTVDLDTAQANLERLVSARDSAREALTKAEIAHATAVAKVDSLTAQVATLDDELAGVSPRAELSAILERTVEARRILTSLKDEFAAATAALKKAEKDQGALAGERTKARQAFQITRDKVAALEPPAIVDDLALDWSALVDWAERRGGEMKAGLDAQSEKVKGLTAHGDALATQLAGLLEGVPSGPTPQERVGAALLGARRDLEDIRKARARMKELGVDIAAAQERSAVASVLARHLHSNRFESWVLEEALAELTAGANDLLAKLSNDAYALETDKRGFAIIDHRNADQERSVRTLSGGETFLVSLALALSLSEQLTRMSAQGTSKLESIFLDEGFGTLDQETLDVVASVVQELGAAGLTVGLISHVPDLAEQVPTRFVVTKDVSGAHVERVDS